MVECRTKNVDHGIAALAILHPGHLEVQPIDGHHCVAYLPVCWYRRKLTKAGQLGWGKVDEYDYFPEIFREVHQGCTGNGMTRAVHDLIVSGQGAEESSEARRPGVAPLPTPAQADLLVPVLKALAHPIRLRLVSLVASHPDGEACVCTISSGFSVSGPTISHHLRMLREAGVLDCQRRGTWVYYRTRPQVLDELAKFIGTPMVCDDSSKISVVRSAASCS